MSEAGPSGGADRIIVGVDGSAHSRAALAWAGRQARLTGAPLVAIIAWEYPMSFGDAIIWPDAVDFAADARAALADATAAVLGSDPPIEVDQVVVEGRAAKVLEEASRTAALVVVGSRGYGEFTGMLLGSVSGHLSAHAHCPVVIIRDEET